MGSRINHEYKCIFVHIPKTGGSSINYGLCRGFNTLDTSFKDFRVDTTTPSNIIKDKHFTPVSPLIFDAEKCPKWVTMIGPKHSPLSFVLKDSPTLKDYFSFSFVRNPWCSTVSMYHYLWTSEKLFPRRWRRNNEYFSKLSFTEWVKHPYFQSPCLRPRDVKGPGGRCGSFLSWITHNGREVDFLGRFENLQEDFSLLCDKIGIPRKELRHRNKTDHKHYSFYYDDETREIVAQKYANDIERFGYEFERMP